MLLSCTNAMEPATGFEPVTPALRGPRSVDVGSMTDEQLRNALLRGLREIERGEATEVSVAFSQMKEELSGA